MKSRNPVLQFPLILFSAEGRTGGTCVREYTLNQEGAGSVRFISVPDFGSVRFDSFRFRKFVGSVRFGSENQNSLFDPVPPASFGRVAARSDSVRFCVWFRPVPKFNGSVRFGSVWFGSVRFGSVRPARFGFSFLPVVRSHPPKRIGLRISAASRGTQNSAP